MDKSKLIISWSMVRGAGVFVCGGVTMVAFVLVVLNYNSYLQTKKKFTQNSARLLTLESDRKELNKLLARYHDDNARIQALLFTDEDISDFLDKMGEFAKASEVKIVDMKTQKFERVKSLEESKPGFHPAKKPVLASDKKEDAALSLASMQIRMNIEGNFEHLFHFLVSLEQYRQLVTLTNVGIRRQTYPALNCQFTLRLYSLRQLDAASAS